MIPHKVQLPHLERCEITTAKVVEADFSMQKKYEIEFFTQNRPHHLVGESFTSGSGELRILGGDSRHNHRLEVVSFTDYGDNLYVVCGFLTVG